MPKERKDRSVSHERLRASPLYCESSRVVKPSEKQVKEWEEARCPVCMEHPHNGILLICSSFDNGCRPYMCDTSHRHSNCFDQYCKASKAETEAVAIASDSTTVNLRQEAAATSGVGVVAATEVDQEKTKQKLTCPLCRGHIKEWVAVEAARGFMNAKHRSCSSETCDYSGTYSDLRKHARLQHPGVRPSEADPERQRSWRRLERQRDLGDLLSTFQSSFGGGEERSSSNEDGILSFDDGGWLTVFFLIRVFRPESSGSRSSSSWSGTSRARTQIGVRRRSSRLWGESYEGDTGTSSRRDEENNQSSDEQESRRRGRRRAFIDDDDDDDDDEEEP